MSLTINYFIHAITENILGRFGMFDDDDDDDEEEDQQNDDKENLPAQNVRHKSFIL